jgi:hypothetical protein
MTRGIHPFASFTPRSRPLEGGAGRERRVLVLRHGAGDPASLLDADAVRVAAPLMFCDDADAIMHALGEGPVRLILFDGGTPDRGLLDPAVPLAPLLTSPFRGVPRVLLSPDPDSVTGSWSRGRGWFREIARAPLDGPRLESLLAAHDPDH